MYEIKRTSIGGDYSLMQDGEEIFVFKASKMFSSTSQAIYQHQPIDIRKTHFFSRTHQVWSNGEVLATIEFNWEMNATIYLTDHSGVERSLKFNKTHVLASKFELICTDPDFFVLSLSFNLRLSKLNVTYELDVEPRTAELFDLPLLILCCMHVLRRHRKTGSGGWVSRKPALPR